MINEIIAYVKENPVESGLYAASAVYWSCVFYIAGKSILKNKNIEDRLTEDGIFSEK